MRFLLILAAYAALTVSAFAQTDTRGGPTSDRDVIAQPVMPAPENGNIIIYFGDTNQIYFKLPIRSIKLDDPYIVSAEPRSDHIVAFTGLSPGVSRVTIETRDGRSSTWGVVTTVRPVHEVKIYTPTPAPDAKAVAARGGTVIINEAQHTQEDDKADYRSVLCNEIGCRQPPKK